MGGMEGTLGDTWEAAIGAAPHCTREEGEEDREGRDEGRMGYLSVHTCLSNYLHVHIGQTNNDLYINMYTTLHGLMQPQRPK